MVRSVLEDMHGDFAMHFLHHAHENPKRATRLSVFRVDIRIRYHGSRNPGKQASGIIPEHRVDVGVADPAFP
jgi:hypothetical protein